MLLLASSLFPMLAQAQAFDFNTVNGITLGLGIEELKQQYPQVSVPEDDGTAECYYIQMPEMAHVQWMILDGRVARAELPATYKSPSLPVVSDFLAGRLTPEEAAARYRNIEIDEHEYHDGYRVAFFNNHVDQADRAVVADYVNHKIENIRVGLIPAAMFIEGCS